MGTAYPDIYQSGLILPDPRLSFWEGESGVYSAGGAREGPLGEASPRPSIPVPATATDLALRSSGPLQEAVEIRGNRAGLPVLDGFGYLSRANGGALADWMGCDLPHAPSGFEAVSSAARYTPHVIPMWWGEVTALAGYDVDQPWLSIRRNAAGHIYSGTSFAEVLIDGTAVTNPYPCLLRLPSGRVLAYRWGDDGADHQVYSWYSDDGGATWTELGPVLAVAIDGTAYPHRRRLRAVYLPVEGTIALFGHIRAVDSGAGVPLYEDRIAQWASSDGGYTFSLVTISDGSDEEHAGAWFDVAVWRGEIVLARLMREPGLGTAEIRVRRIPSAWYAWTTGEELWQSAAVAATWGRNHGVYLVDVVDIYYSEGECALWADDDGSLYLTSRHCSGAYDGACPLMRSVDGGETWEVTGNSLLYAGRGQAWNWTGSAATEVSDLTGCAVAGRSVVLHRAASVHATADLLYSTYLGGWTSAPMPSVSQGILPTRRTSWEHTGTAAQRPDEAGWTRGVGGAPVETFGAGYISHVTAAGESINYSETPPGTAAEGILYHHACRVISGQVDLTLTLRTAVPADWQARVEITPTSIRLWDVNAGAPVGAPLAYTTGPVSILVSMSTSTIRVLALTSDRLGSSLLVRVLGAQARPFREVAATAALVAGGGAPANSIVWSTTASSEARHYWWFYTSDAYCGDHWYSQPPRQKIPRSLCEAPSSAIYGSLLSSVSGPGVPGDEWDIDVGAQYPHEAPLPTVDPSPRHVHRTGSIIPWLIGAVGATGRISYQLHGATQNAHAALWGVLIESPIPGQTVYLYYGGIWVLAATVGDWRFSADIVGRDLVISAGAAANSAVLRRDELVGCIAEITDNAGTTSIERLTVVSNEPGRIDTTAGISLPLRVELDATPASVGNVKVRIYPRRTLVIIDLSLHSSSIRGIQLRWSIPRKPVIDPMPVPGLPPTDYYEVATFAPGPLWPFGCRHDWGRRLSTEADTELLTYEDGTRAAFERAPARRTTACTWGDGVPEHDYDTPDRAPDYTTYNAGAAPTAFKWWTPVDLADIIRRLAGSATAIVWVPALDPNSGRSDHWAHGAYVGRITSAVDRDLVVGDEEHGPVERVQELVIEEEL